MATRPIHMTGSAWVAGLTTTELAGVVELLARGLRRNDTLEDWARAVLQRAIADGLVRSGAPG